jgi:hypothetical protein
MPDITRLAGDFRIFTKSFTAPSSVSAAGQFLAQSANRWSMLVCPTGTTDIRVSTDAGIGTPDGLLLRVGQLPFNLNFRDHGSLVGAGWFAGSAGLATTGYVIEVQYWPRGQEASPEEMQAILERLKGGNQ